MNLALRPTAAAALMHPYFRSTFVERLLQEGEVVEQDRKLEAVRDLLHKVRQENRWVVLPYFTLFYSILLKPTLLYITLFYSAHLPDLCCQYHVFEFLICHRLHHFLFIENIYFLFFTLQLHTFILHFLYSYIPSSLFAPFSPTFQE
jgi:hypothetical protein